MSTQKIYSTSAFTTRKLTTISMLSAVGMLLSIFETPLIPGVTFLLYDPSNIPIIIGSLMFGPIPGLIMSVLISFVQSFLIHGSGGPIGFIMQVAATGAMSVVIGLIYKYSKKNIPSLLVSLIIGGFVTTGVMVCMNLWLTPIFMGTVLQEVIDMLLPVIIPFNLIKATINITTSFIVYKFIGKLIIR